MAKNKKDAKESKPEIIEGELCPICHKKTLTLMESQTEVPFFGICHLFGMDCKDCGYHLSDVEADEQKEPCKYTLDISDEKDMHIRIVKSSAATVKLPHLGNIEPGEASNGYITNVEGILNRMKKILEDIRDNDEEEEENRKKAKNMIKKITRIVWGQEKQRLIIEDPNGNSAIISEKAVKEKFKK
ncbi:MAG: ZPR1 zinc finger domain-containing protein [archaeon]